HRRAVLPQRGGRRAAGGRGRHAWRARGGGDPLARRGDVHDLPHAPASARVPRGGGWNAGGRTGCPTRRAGARLRLPFRAGRTGRAPQAADPAAAEAGHQPPRRAKRLIPRRADTSALPFSITHSDRRTVVAFSAMAMAGSSTTPPKPSAGTCELPMVVEGEGARALLPPAPT